jgi:adenosylcobinamide kinase/adenosylcobinamide-phosphate guanylyltransferase
VGFRRVFVLGGARSGKSTFAERLAGESGDAVLYVATARPSDEEMAERIAQHQARRPPTWQTIEEPTDIARRLAAVVHPAALTVIVEDLTLLLANFLDLDGATGEQRALAELEALVTVQANLIVVSNEVGMGVVPPYPSGRVFRDSLGRLNQRAAALSDDVYVLFAGVPLKAK